MRLNLIVVSLAVFLLHCIVNECFANKKSFDLAVDCWNSNAQRALSITDSLLSVKTQNEVEVWKLWDLQAKIFLRQRNTIKAIDRAQKADSAYKSVFHTSFADAHRIMAISYKDQGNLPQSLIHYHIAILHAEDSLSRLNNLFNMTEVEIAAGDTASAIRHLESNINQIINLPENGYKGCFYMQYARILTALKPHDEKALSFFMKAAEILESNKDFERAGFAATGVAEVYDNLNLPDSCRWWYKKAIDLQLKSNGPLGLANIYSNFADYELGRNNYKEALILYLKAWPFAQKANYLPVTKNILKNLAEAYEKNGDYKSGIRFLKKYNELTDSIEKQKWQEQVAELQIKYSIKEKNEQLLNLQQRVGANSRMSLVYYLGLFVIISVGSISMFRRRKKSNISPVFTEMEIKKSHGKGRIELWLELKKLLEHDKVYRNPDLSLNSLALQLKTNRSTLSEVINTHGNKSFSILINHYRVKEACELLSDPSASHLTVEGIGIDTGFKSRSAFYAAFTTEIGETPSVFRKRQKIPFKSFS